MAPSFSEIVEEARLSARALLDYGESLFNPTVRLGVTGLSRAGKTVFITALIHGLTRGGRFPVFEAFASGRIAPVAAWIEVEASCFNWKIVMDYLQTVRTPN